MLEHLGAALSSNDFMPHGMCFLWQPTLLWLHVVSDALTAFAYYSIPFALVYFVWKRQDLVFPSVFLLFGAFILACGTTHLMGIWTIWHPDYWLDGGIKLFTGVVSVLSALFLWRIMPQALALPSRSQLETANRALAQEIGERQRAEATVRRMNQELEERVRERTRELEAINRRLRTALHEKEVLLREVHHRVKNNLQVVASLLTLQASRTDPALKHSFQASLERIRAMGRVHEQLYRAEDASCFDPAAYIRTICADLGEIYGSDGRITWRVEARAPVRIPLDTATPLALIVNEVISNAYKHAFPDGRRGEIQVIIGEVEAGTLIEIRDNGVGLPDGREVGDGPSMGWRLVQLLAQQIDATATFLSDGGTRFSLVLPHVPENE
ncbi:sensor histidine kinase [Benzoatithermus flavus]|uniref:histidine kinase n=1 Tax=Benzoatithermus flavus TaxID=3108223 RepID=A0ABU8XNM2_9PROT